MTGMPATSVAALVRSYRSKELSPVEVARICLDAVHTTQQRLNAFRHVDADAVLEQARASERRWRAAAPCGRLDGVPVAIKDTFDVAGWSTWSGSLTTERAPARHDAPAVQRLKAEGATLIGKTTTPEFGWKAVTDSPATGTTRNPWDVTRTPGGSSGGSAVAVSAGLSLLGLGSDGGGSIRIPAAFTGVVGLKPSHGLVPVWPSSVLHPLAHVGPLARTVGDAALMLDVIAGPHPWDWTGGPPGVRYASAIDSGVTGLRVAVVTDAYGHPADADVTTAVLRASQVLADQGAHVDQVSMPFAKPAQAFDTLWFAGMAHRITTIPAHKRDRLDPELRARADAAPASAGQLCDAIATVMRLRETMGIFHERFDLLLTPTTPVTAFCLDLPGPPPFTARDSWTSWTPYTYPFNMTQQPAMSLPFGRSVSGLPVGVQVAAAKHRDDLVLRAGRVLERSVGMW